MDQLKNPYLLKKSRFVQKRLKALMLMTFLMIKSYEFIRTLHSDMV